MSACLLAFSLSTTSRKATHYVIRTIIRGVFIIRKPYSVVCIEKCISEETNGPTDVYYVLCVCKHLCVCVGWLVDWKATEESMRKVKSLHESRRRTKITMAGLMFATRISSSTEYSQDQDGDAVACAAKRICYRAQLFVLVFDLGTHHRGEKIK